MRGGVSRAHHANDPLVQAFRRLVARYKMERVVHYEDLAVTLQKAEARRAHAVAATAAADASGIDSTDGLFGAAYPVNPTAHS